MKARRQSGSSALELVITVAVFAMVMSGLVGVLQSATSSSRQFEGVGGLDEKAWQVTDGIVRELRWAEAGTLLVTQDSGSSRLDFRVPTGAVGGAVTWSSTITVKYAASNLDADHDGKADDGALVRIQDGVTRVLCNEVPVGGFAVAVNGANLALTLQLQATDAERRVERSRATESASVRN
jgi:hypothetical protein